MREIKFRVWHPPITDKETGKILPGYMDYELAHYRLLSVRTETKHIPDNFGFEHIQTGLYFINKDLAEYGDKLMLYTGLKDSKQKEIFEGDIVKFNVTYSFDNPPVPTYDSEEGTEMIDTVEYKDGAFFFVSPIIGGGAYAYRHAKNCEVIGDIHSTPELLK